MHLVGPVFLMQYPAQANRFKRLAGFVLTITSEQTVKIPPLWGKSER